MKQRIYAQKVPGSRLREYETAAEAERRDRARRARRRALRAYAVQASLYAEEETKPWLSS